MKPIWQVGIGSLILLNSIPSSARGFQKGSWRGWRRHRRRAWRGAGLVQQLSRGGGVSPPSLKKARGLKPRAAGFTWRSLLCDHTFPTATVRSSQRNATIRSASFSQSTDGV